MVEEAQRRAVWRWRFVHVEVPTAGWSPPCCPRPSPYSCPASAEGTSWRLIRSVAELQLLLRQMLRNNTFLQLLLCLFCPAGFAGVWSGGICLLWWVSVHGALQRGTGGAGTGGAEDGEPVYVFVLVLLRGSGDGCCFWPRQDSGGQQRTIDPPGHRKCCCCRFDVFKTPVQIWICPGLCCVAVFLSLKRKVKLLCVADDHSVSGLVSVSLQVWRSTPSQT